MKQVNIGQHIAQAQDDDYKTTNLKTFNFYNICTINTINLINNSTSTGI